MQYMHSEGIATMGVKTNMIDINSTVMYIGITIQLAIISWILTDIRRYLKND
jgi:hypothetical protein